MGSREKPSYLSLLTDAYSKVGYHVSDSLATEAPLKALKRVLKKKPKNLIHHSDRGLNTVQMIIRNYCKKTKSVAV
nr:hypothetical protein [Chryseobacterium nematophagum]